jgi:hypothetical protein
MRLRRIFGTQFSVLSFLLLTSHWLLPTGRCSAQSAPPNSIVTSNGQVILLPPDAPEPFQPPVKEKPSFWTFGGPDAPAPLRTNHEVFHDRFFLSEQAFWLSAIVYDSEITHQGIAHHRCQEGNQNLPAHPSRGQIYRSDIPEYAVGTAYNFLMMKYMWKPLSMLFPAVGGTEHIRGGSEWLLNCW